jgi:hypothetical protein
MPSVDAMNIVNKIFSGSKDLSNEVDVAMKTISTDAFEAKKREIAANWMNPEPTEENDETDYGND